MWKRIVLITIIIEGRSCSTEQHLFLAETKKERKKETQDALHSVPYRDSEPDFLRGNVSYSSDRQIL